MKLSIVLSTHAARFEAVAFKGDFEVNVAKIANWGYDGVELAIRDPSLVNADQLEDVISAYRLEVPAIGTGQAWGEEGLSFTSDDIAVRTTAIERVKSHIPLASRFDAIIILGMIRGMTPKGQTNERSLSYLVESLLECATAASDQGVRFALEPLNRYETDLIHTVADGLDLLNRVAAENVGLLLDTFHMNIEEPKIEESIRECGDRIFHFHVADSNRWYPGAGHLDFVSILDALFECGYAGYISGEFMPKPNADVAAQQNLAYMQQLLL
jgi:sugar phosphate isomerase/epimerase